MRNKGRYKEGITTTPVITFDAGQTLVELDLDFLGRRLAERGLEVAPDALSAAAPAAWRRYDELVAAGTGHPWRALMTTLLQGAGVREVDPTVEWLWSEQPRVNLWRKPITEMVDLARELARTGACVAVLSNSEGRLAELLQEISIADPFTVIVDSGRLGIEKPDRRIFDHMLAALGIAGADPIHIGDSWAADIVGARDAGWRSIWYGRGVTPTNDPRIASAPDPAAVRAALVAFGVLQR
ncbi:MAG: HAD family hydrolase [Deltaproteobacteria bacterium]|nr:HAD family hydrolase [Deltaproteobacteria bacterium]